MDEGQIAIDPGAPVEHDFETPAAPVAKPVAAEPAEDVKTLREERDAAVAKAKRAEDDANFWSERARRGSPRDDDEEPARRPAARQEEPEDPAKLLDDLSSKGSAALLERGFVSKADLDKAVASALATSREEISKARTDASTDAELTSQFPEIAEDFARVTRGEAPQTELWRRAQAIYRAGVQRDPQMKESKSFLISAAGQAKAEMERDELKKGKPAEKTERNGDGQFVSRRQKIEAQSVSRPSGSGADDDGETPLDAEAMTVMRNMGLTEKEYRGQIRGGEKIGKKTRNHA